MTRDKLPGLDMKFTIDWYSANHAYLSEQLPGTSRAYFPFPVVHTRNVQLTKGELSGAWRLFPVPARKRSLLRKVVGTPETWFHKNCTQHEILTTTDHRKAVSPTAIVPAFTSTEYWRKTGKPKCDVFLYRVDNEACSPEVRNIILKEAFVHEIAHTLFYPAWYLNYKLKLPNGKTVDGKEYLTRFADLAEHRKPISHYAANYRGEKGKFESKKKNYDIVLAINEEFAETVAAKLLGFSFCDKDEKRSKKPFADRPELSDFVDDFLHAKVA